MNQTGVDATSAFARTFGIYGGFFAFEHGIGEILQGNAAITGTRIYAYGPPGLPFPFGREPAMTLIPNYLATGIFALLAGLLVVFWSAMFLRKVNGGLVLSALAVALLLGGGGYGPFPVLVMAAIASVVSASKHSFQRRTLPLGPRRAVASTWPWLFSASLAWVPLEIVLGFFFKFGYPFPGFALSFAIPLMMLATLLTGFAHDSLRDHSSARTPIAST